MVWEVSVDARDKQAPKDGHQRHYYPPVRLEDGSFLWARRTDENLLPTLEH